MATGPSRSRVRIVTKNNFPQFRGKAFRGVKMGVEDGIEAGAMVARSLVPVGDGESGILPGHLRDTIGTTRVTRTRRGYAGGFGSPDPTLVFLDQGTHGRRSRRIKGNSSRERSREIRRKFLRQTAEGRSTGIRPRRFMLKATRVAVDVAMRKMKASSRRLR